MSGRGGGRPRGRGRGRGRAAERSSPPPTPSSSSSEMDVEPTCCSSSSSFVDRARIRRLPDSFAEYVGAVRRARCILGGFVRLLPVDRRCDHDARGKMYLNIGWEKFARHHSLEAGFILRFSYFGNRDMSVKVFDERRCRRDYHNDMDYYGDKTDEEDDRVLFLHSEYVHGGF
ncbi:hypothetical protein QYE76_026881 [Lolium multiflorum]|uniref:TF-B3 domain-containing protein n=1 Tax=Lolium multiflorum TaxID=4521 RepID=A0AAD8VW12_LOLMU|nr:hypothetical protein QYE76_026881 [Lolium multiflorum]